MLSHFTKTIVVATLLFAQLSLAQNSVISRPAQTVIDDFQIFAEEALVWRAKSLEFATSNKKKLNKSNLTYAELDMIYKKGVQYLELRQRLLKIAQIYAPFVSSKSDISLQPHTGTSEAAWQPSQEKDQSMPTATPAPAFKIRIDPSDALGRQHIYNLKLSLAAALILYDNYMIGIYPYQSAKKIRYLLNRDVRGLRNQLEKVTDSFFDLEQRLAMSRAVQLYRQISAWDSEHYNITDPNENYLDDLITQSPFAQFLSKDSIELKQPSKLRAYFDRFYDRWNFLKRTSSFITSALFGNAVGLIAFRQGYLNNLNREERNSITEGMQPLDVLLEKTPFRLTDRFIPGYYGHVAIWVGNEEQLKELDLWDHPLVKPHQQAIRSGHHIVEALRPGVQINTLEHFLNIDDLLVLRHTQLDREQTKDALLRAFAQIGKDYDFNFDVETDKRIVCSEIAYVVFADISWPTSRSLGRWTISPDNVANLAVGEGPFTPVLMYRNGQLIDGNLEQELRRNLKSSPAK